MHHPCLFSFLGEVVFYFAQFLISQILILVMAVCLFFLELETPVLTEGSHFINMCSVFNGNQSTE